MNKIALQPVERAVYALALSAAHSRRRACERQMNQLRMITRLIANVPAGLGSSDMEGLTYHAEEVERHLHPAAAAYREVEIFCEEKLK